MTYGYILWIVHVSNTYRLVYHTSLGITINDYVHSISGTTMDDHTSIITWLWRISPRRCSSCFASNRRALEEHNLPRVVRHPDALGLPRLKAGGFTPRRGETVQQRRELLYSAELLIVVNPSYQRSMASHHYAPKVINQSSKLRIVYPITKCQCLSDWWGQPPPRKIWVNQPTIKKKWKIRNVENHSRAF